MEKETKKLQMQEALKLHPAEWCISISVFLIWIFFLFFVFPKDAHSSCLIQQRPAVEQTLDAKENFIIKLQMCLKFHGNYEYTPKYIPEEIALAQAIVESGWGTSRFAKEGNALFGIRTWDLSTPHLKPLGNPNAKFGVKKYNSWCHSVEDYLDTINTSQHYSEFRTLRDEGASTPALLDALDKYSEDKTYTKTLLRVIKRLP
jgi:uncharacterized FlgJ-related protein